MTTVQNYPDVGTLIYLDNIGFPLNARMAVMEVVWYVMFKAPHL